MDASYHNCAGQTFILETQIVSWHLAGQSYEAHLGIWTFCGLRKACVCLIRSLCCVGKQWPRVIAEWLSNDTKAIVVLFHLFQQHRFPQLLLAWSEFSIRSVFFIEQNYGGLHSGSSSLLSRMVNERCMAHKIPSFRIILILSGPFAGNFVTCLNTELLFLTTSEGNIKSVYYLHIYHPPTELWEGNVFSCMCLSSGLSPQG